MTQSGRTSPTEACSSQALAARIVSIIGPLRCHLCAVPYGHGTPTDERPFGCTVCRDARRLVAELRGLGSRRCVDRPHGGP